MVDALPSLLWDVLSARGGGRVDEATRTESAVSLSELLRRTSALVPLDPPPPLPLSAVHPIVWLESGEFSDVMLRSTDGVLFPVHKLLLVKISSYLRALLTGGLQEAAQAEVSVAIESALLRPVLRFLYTSDGEVAGVDSENATELLGVAGMLQVPGAGAVL